MYIGKEVSLAKYCQTNKLKQADFEVKKKGGKLRLYVISKIGYTKADRNSLIFVHGKTPMSAIKQYVKDTKEKPTEWNVSKLTGQIFVSDDNIHMRYASYVYASRDGKRSVNFGYNFSWGSEHVYQIEKKGFFQLLREIHTK